MSAQPQVLESGVLVLRWRACSWLLAWRPLCVTTLLAAGLLGAVVLALLVGSQWLSPAVIWQVVQGDASSSLLILEFRLPRVLVAVVAGMALALAGGLLQTLTGNRLASPELLGLTDGATCTMLIALVLSPEGSFGPWWVGPLGALLAMASLLVVSGGVGQRGQRMLIVGIGLACLLRAMAELALSQQSLQHASAIYAWTTGSLAGKGTATLLPLAAGLAVLLPLAMLCRRQLALLRLDVDVAATLGVPVRAVQWLTLLTAVSLAGLAVGLCGPLAFVALAAPIIAERWAGGAAMPLPACALLGGMLVVLADLLGRILLPNAELPAGVICNLLGGPFLLWVLLGKGSAGKRE
ncbi:iron complex transport system permease protein [Andreprevotia lacus DSM 23236]|jgi:iron complex transport system permease protein|uniref:Iron complex transport system permease protein n=1 Tax=Andreprevotia lacus DSM 23236 TaxID=1121001 RepID=A0A1W1XPU1_9NEIS|nr:iron ABC transporter permease [Andreprevotia lacus]SMC25906.1 iron complex transport system permease protein [Andreprevotia lacus DSM 23236]